MLKLYTWSWCLQRGGDRLEVVWAAAQSTLEGIKWRGWRNRCREEVPFGNCAGEEGTKEDRVLGLLLLQSLLSPGPRAGVSEDTFGELRTQKLKVHRMRAQSLKVLPLKPGVGQNIAMHATLTARDFFLAYFFPWSPFTCVFSKTSSELFLC